MWLAPEDISFILNGLQNMEDHEDIRTFLATLIPHIKTIDQNNRPFTIIHIDRALSGLQHLAKAPETIQILELFTQFLTSLKRNSLEKAFLQKWLAHAIHYMKAYFEYPLTQDAALAFTNKAFQTVLPEVEINFNDLLEEKTCTNTLIQIGDFLHHHSKKIDLKGYSYSGKVASLIYTYLLETEQKGRWQIDFGEKEYNTQTKKAIQAQFLPSSDISFSIKSMLKPSRPKRVYSKMENQNLGIEQATKRLKLNEHSDQSMQQVYQTNSDDTSRRVVTTTSPPSYSANNPL